MSERATVTVTEIAGVLRNLAAAATDAADLLMLAAGQATGDAEAGHEPPVQAAVLSDDQEALLAERLADPRYVQSLLDRGPLAVYAEWQHLPDFRALHVQTRQDLVAAIAHTHGNDVACDVSRDLLRR